MSCAIAIMTTDSHIGGTEKTVCTLLQHLDRSRHRIYCIVLKEGGELLPYYEKYSDGLLALNMRSLVDVVKIKSILSFLKENNIFVVHSFLFHANIMARLCKMMMPQLVCVNSHRTMEMDQRWHLFVDRWTKAFVDYEISNAESVRTFYHKHTGIGAASTRVIYNGVESCGDLSQQREMSPKDGDDVPIVFGVVGSFTKAKGHHMLLEAFARLAQTHGHVYLRCIGDGPLRESCCRFVARQGLTDRVAFIGKTDDVAREYGSIDCLVISSVWEGVPNVALEALSCAIPVIATKVGGIPEIANIAGGVHIVPSKDIAAMHRQMQLFCEKKEYYDSVAREASHIVRSQFSVERMIGEYEDFYKNIMVETNRDI